MKPEVRREQILRAAIKVFAAKGYHRASVSDIIAAAGIARGTFYLYFEGKRDIFAELVDVLTVRLSNCMRRVDLAPGAPPWLSQIRANVVRIAQVLLEERELTQILYNHAMGLDEEFDRKIREFYEVMNRRTEAAFRLGQEMGLIKKDLNPLLAAYHLVGSMKEVIYRAALGGKLALPVEKLADELIALSAHGLLAAPKPKTARTRNQ